MTQPEAQRIPWKPIAALGQDESLANAALGALDALRAEWQRRLEALAEPDRARIRQRTLRKLAIETGILERLYDVEWGLTLTLVAEGFTREVVERAGGAVDDRTLATLRSHMESLEMVLDFVSQERPLTAGFIRELHQALTRTQQTYTATDALGRVFEATLPHGDWKKTANHVLRQDGRILEYCPPEHVASEVDRLVELWAALDAEPEHPVVKAAWLHHRFVQIHPFADGNGRVARALTLLVLEKHRYAPLVVDRWHRPDYLRALDAANEGDLRDLVRLFARLETAALTTELDRPEEPAVSGLSGEVAHTLAAQLAERQRRLSTEIQAKVRSRATAVAGRALTWFRRKRDELEQIFRAQGLADVLVQSFSGVPPSAAATWFRRQIYESAHTAGHYADLATYAAWFNLRVQAGEWRLRFVASLHGAGKEPGVVALTTFGELEERPEAPEGEGDADTAQRPIYLQTTKDAFAVVHTESVEDIEKRAGDLEALLDEGLSAALAELLKRV